MGELNIEVPKDIKLLKLMKLQRHGFIGVNEIFKLPERRFGAVCTEDMLFLRFSIERKINKEWRRLLKSTYWQLI